MTETRYARFQGPTGSSVRKIPWELHEKAAEQYNKFGYSQSSEKLHERGGFGWMELVCLLGGIDPFAQNWKDWK